ncbi:30S ribosomal protein S17e [Candidatus Woesearchaeota archaeon]|nr:30S ribosomal protein S17e [Candidatus Woesearchaeota archaeon]
MGRIKTKLIKRTTNELIHRHMDDFKVDFEQNKRLVSKFMDIPSKKMRNIIAGYVTRLSKKKETI